MVQATTRISVVCVSTLQRRAPLYALMLSLHTSTPPGEYFPIPSPLFLYCTCLPPGTAPSTPKSRCRPTSSLRGLTPLHLHPHPQRSSFCHPPTISWPPTSTSSPTTTKRCCCCRPRQPPALLHLVVTVSFGVRLLCAKLTTKVEAEDQNEVSPREKISRIFEDRTCSHEFCNHICPFQLFFLFITPPGEGEVSSYEAADRVPAALVHSDPVLDVWWVFDVHTHVYIYIRGILARARNEQWLILRKEDAIFVLCSGHVVPYRARIKGHHNAITIAPNQQVQAFRAVPEAQAQRDGVPQYARGVRQPQRARAHRPVRLHGARRAQRVS